MQPHKKVNPEFLSRFTQMTGQAVNICLASHKCDDDATSSLLVLYHLLHKQYPEKNIRVVVARSSNDRWRYLKYYEKIEFSGKIVPVKGPCPDLLILVDTHSYRNLDINTGEAQRLNVKTICMDHHASPSDRFDLALIDEEASSVAELIYYLFFKDKSTLDPHIAQTLLLGILGDTSNLRYITPERQHVFSVIQRLISEQEINLGYFLPLWQGYTERIYTIFQELVKNGVIERIGSWYPFLRTFITREFIESKSYTLIEIDEASAAYCDYFLAFTNEIRWVMVFSPIQDGDMRVRMRSQPKSVNVRIIAESLKIGGGHNFSASGLMRKFDGRDRNATECFEVLKNWLHKNELIVT